jgi:hypothetical protein
LLPRFRIVPHHPLPLLLGHRYLTVEAMRFFPLTHGAATPANKRERRRNVGGLEGPASRQCVCVDRHGLFFTHALLRGHFLPATFTERFPFPLRFVLTGLPGAILGEYNESQT